MNRKKLRQKYSKIVIFEKKDMIVLLNYNYNY